MNPFRVLIERFTCLQQYFRQINALLKQSCVLTTCGNAYLFVKILFEIEKIDRIRISYFP